MPAGTFDAQFTFALTLSEAALFRANLDWRECPYHAGTG
jgi:hypothetical protein